MKHWQISNIWMFISASACVYSLPAAALFWTCMFFESCCKTISKSLAVLVLLFLKSLCQPGGLTSLFSNYISSTEAGMVLPRAAHSHEQMQHMSWLFTHAPLLAGSNSLNNCIGQQQKTAATVDLCIRLWGLGIRDTKTASRFSWFKLICFQFKIGIFVKIIIFGMLLVI